MHFIPSQSGEPLTFSLSRVLGDGVLLGLRGRGLVLALALLPVLVLPSTALRDQAGLGLGGPLGLLLLVVVVFLDLAVLGAQLDLRIQQFSYDMFVKQIPVSSEAQVTRGFLELREFENRSDLVARRHRETYAMQFTM